MNILINELKEEFLLSLLYPFAVLFVVKGNIFTINKIFFVFNWMCFVSFWDKHRRIEQYFFEDSLFVHLFFVNYSISLGNVFYHVWSSEYS